MTEARLTSLGPGLWQFGPMDETWLESLVHHGSALAPAATALAVVREHPQDDVVKLSGTAAELLAGAAALQRELAELLRKARGQKRDDAAFLAPNFRVANMVRRALLTRPRALAAVEVAFLEGVESIEYEPMAAQRLGMLGFRGALGAHEAALWVPAGEEALSAHLRLPPGVTLAPGCGRVPLGLRARAGEGPQHLADVALRADSVFRTGHVKFQPVAMSAYEPEVRLLTPPPEAKETLRAAGYVLRIGNVVASATPQIAAVRRERILQLLPGATIEEPPRHIRVDFEPLAHASKRAALLAALEELQLEVQAFVAAVAKA